MFEISLLSKNLFPAIFIKFVPPWSSSYYPSFKSHHISLLAKSCCGTGEPKLDVCPPHKFYSLISGFDSNAICSGLAKCFKELETTMAQMANHPVQQVS
jgi:hypothetical protein